MLLQIFLLFFSSMKLLAWYVNFCWLLMNYQETSIDFILLKIYWKFIINCNCISYFVWFFLIEELNIFIHLSFLDLNVFIVKSWASVFYSISCSIYFEKFYYLKLNRQRRKLNVFLAFTSFFRKILFNWVWSTERVHKCIQNKWFWNYGQVCTDASSLQGCLLINYFSWEPPSKQMHYACLRCNDGLFYIWSQNIIIMIKNVELYCHIFELRNLYNYLFLL